jgi:hypothetical protein
MQGFQLRFCPLLGHRVREIGISELAPLAFGPTMFTEAFLALAPAPALTIASLARYCPEPTLLSL